VKFLPLLSVYLVSSFSDQVLYGFTAVDSIGGGGAGYLVNTSKKLSVGSLNILQGQQIAIRDIQSLHTGMPQLSFPSLFPHLYWVHRDVNAENEIKSAASHLLPAQNES
jgi:hypothetical protein